MDKVFMTSDCLLITKVNLVPPLPVDIEFAVKEAKEINPKLKTFDIGA